MDLKITPSGQTIVKPTALGPGANTDTKLLIYGLFQKGRVLAQDGPRVASLTGILPDPISTPPRPTPGSRGAELSSKSHWSLIRRSIRMAPSCAPKHERELTKCRDFVSQNRF